VQRRDRTASHVVEHGARPDDIDDATLEWWVDAGPAPAGDGIDGSSRRLHATFDGGGAR
jgi:hypothetical protein